MASGGERPGRPEVAVHVMTSLDGRLTGFPADLGLYYELAGSFPQQAVLTGSATLLDAAAREGVDLSGEDPLGDAEVPRGGSPPRDAPTDDPRPWLVVVDGRGRLSRFAWLRDQPFWRDVLVLCCASTPPAQLERLRRHRIAHLVVGTAHVDLVAALHELAERHGVRAVRVDAGGTLSGLLVRAGLVDEISVVVAPYLVGTADARAVHLVDGLAEGDVPQLTLTGVEQLRDGHVWLRYRPVRPAAPMAAPPAAPE